MRLRGGIPEGGPSALMGTSAHLEGRIRDQAVTLCWSSGSRVTNICRSSRDKSLLELIPSPQDRTVSPQARPAMTVTVTYRFEPGEPPPRDALPGVRPRRCHRHAPTRLSRQAGPLRVCEGDSPKASR